MTVFLTGGTGLVGSHIAERIRARGEGVVALVRPSSDTRHLQVLGCELVVGDILDAVPELADRMRGTEAVVHSAALVYRAGRRADYLRVNVEGTERVLRAAALAAPRVLHLSSVAVYAGVSMDRPLTEPRWREADPTRQNPYAESKHRAEASAWGAHERGEVRLTTFRPSVVYGERDRAASQVIGRFASRPVHPLLGGGLTAAPVVYAGNVARGVVAALDRPATVGRAYNLGMDTPITVRDLATTVARLLGRTPRILAVPAPPALALARLVDAATRRLPGVDARDLARAVRLLTTDNPYDGARARLELGWRGHTPHPVALRRTFADRAGARD